MDLRPICEIAVWEYDQPDDADRADRCGDYVQPRCDGDVGVHDHADFEQFFDQRLFIRRWYPADDLLFDQRIFL